MLQTLNKQKLFFFALVGIVIVSLIMITSFAYQKVQVTYDPSSKQGMTINVGKLDVTYTTSNYINETNMPLLNSYETADYTEFTLDNSKSTDNIYYKLMLSDLEYSASLVTEDFNYTLTEIIDNNETIIGSGDFKFLSGTTHTICFNTNKANYIYQGETKKLRLYLWLKQTNKNQNNLENTNFKGKIEINSYFESDATKMLLTNLRIYGNSIQDGTPTVENPINIESLGENSRNLLNLVGRTPVTNVWSGNTDKRIITGKQVFIGITANNYFVTPNLNSYNITENSVTINSKSNGYGIGYDFICKPNETYTLSIDDFTSNKYIAVGYYNESGNYLSSSEILTSDLTFTTPSNCYGFIIVFRPIYNLECIYTNPQLEKGLIETDYKPYKYIDVVSTGKNIFGGLALATGFNNAFSAIKINTTNKTIAYAGSWGENIIFFNNFLPNKQYTFIISTTSTSPNLGVRYIGADGLPEDKIKSFTYGDLKIVNTETRTIYIFKSSVGKTIASLEGYYHSSGTVLYYDESGIFEGNISLEGYEPYQASNITMNLTGYEPLRKIGKVSDYIDLTNGKYVKKIGVIESYNGETINNDYISSTGSLTTGATVYYVLDNEIISDFDSSIINDLYNYGNLKIESNIKPSKIEFSI